MIDHLVASTLQSLYVALLVYCLCIVAVGQPVVFTSGSGALPCYYSSLWGREGERSTGFSGRIADFSYAGHSETGTTTSPRDNGRVNWFNVKDFGARGDTQILEENVWNGTDDYPAVVSALASLADGAVLYFPPGIYTLSRNFTIKKAITLKGAGAGQTTLYFPNSLADLYGPPLRTSGGEDVEIYDDDEEEEEDLLDDDEGDYFDYSDNDTPVDDEDLKLANNACSAAAPSPTTPSPTTPSPDLPLSPSALSPSPIPADDELADPPPWTDPVLESNPVDTPPDSGTPEDPPPALPPSSIIITRPRPSTNTHPGSIYAGEQTDDDLNNNPPVQIVDGIALGSTVGSPAGLSEPQSQEPSPSPSKTRRKRSPGPGRNGMSRWSFGPGMLVYQGQGPYPRLANITRNARNGDQWLQVDDVTQINPGLWVAVAASDHKFGNPYAGRLIQALYGGYEDLLGANICDLVGSREAIFFLAQVDSVDTVAARVKLDRNLIYDLDVEQYRDVKILNYTPGLEDTGIEDLTIRFRGEKYPGHHKENGFNGVYLKDVSNMGIQNVEIINSDNSIVLSNSHFCTLTNITLSNEPVRGKYFTGHHGFWLSYRSSNNLVENFTITFTTFHDASVEGFAHLNVYKNGRGKDLGLEHHRRAPNYNLFSNLYLGKGTRGFHSGGKGTRGTFSGRNQVYWNIQADNPIELPPPNFGPLLTFVGVDLKQSELGSKYKYGWDVEMTPMNETLCPADLHSGLQSFRRRSSIVIVG